MSKFYGAASSMSDIVMPANGLVTREADTAYLSLSRRGRRVGWGWLLIRGWVLINFSAFRMVAYSRWGHLIITVNTVVGIAKITFFQK